MHLGQNEGVFQNQALILEGYRPNMLEDLFLTL